MNIYRGCSHGCIYCDSRSECYGVQDFDTVRVKSDALAVIRNDLRSKTQSGVVATGSMSDPYNPFEKELQLTRHALELLDAYGFGAAVATKGTLITRDADILREIASHSPVLCKITVTTCDDVLAAKLEPRAPSSSALAHTVNGRSVAGGRAIPGSSSRSRGRCPRTSPWSLQQAVLRSPLNPARPPVSAAFPEHLVEGIRAQPRINKKRAAQIPDQHAGHPALQKAHARTGFPGPPDSVTLS